MKKAKRGKTQITLAVMVVALAAAVGLNMKYSADNEKNINTSSKYLGQAEYVNAEVSSENAQSESLENDYFKTLRTERNKTRQEAIDVLEEMLEKTGLTEEEKKDAVAKMTALSLAAEKEAAIETVLKAKGFKNVIAVIGDKDIDIIIDSSADNAKAAQIKDAVISKTSFTPANIKIISAQDNTNAAQ